MGRFLTSSAEGAIWFFRPPRSRMLSQCVLSGVHGEEPAEGCKFSHTWSLQTSRVPQK